MTSVQQALLFGALAALMLLAAWRERGNGNTRDAWLMAALGGSVALGAGASVAFF